MFDNIYKHSGEIGLLGVFNGIIHVTVFCIIFSVLQLNLFYFFPYALYAFITYILFIAIMCEGYSKKEKKGHNRNRGLSLISTTICLLITLYTLWCSHIAHFEKLHYFELLFDPGLLFFHIGQELNNDIFYPALEVLFLMFMFFVICPINKDDVYCESCYSWVDSDMTQIFLDYDVRESVKATPVTGDFSWVDNVSIKASRPNVELQIKYCQSCDQLNLLTAKEYAANDEKVLFQNLIVPKDNFLKILAKLSEKTEKQAQVKPKKKQKSLDPLGL